MPVSVVSSKPHQRLMLFPWANTLKPNCSVLVGVRNKFRARFTYVESWGTVKRLLDLRIYLYKFYPSIYLCTYVLLLSFISIRVSTGSYSFIPVWDEFYKWCSFIINEKLYTYLKPCKQLNNIYWICIWYIWTFKTSSLNIHYKSWILIISHCNQF